jgi:Flp pilus assembly protein TadB
MKSDRALIGPGAAGIAVIAICCGAPLLIVVLSAAGLTGWLLNAEYLLILAPLLCLGVVGLRLYRRRASAQDCCDPVSPQEKVRGHE